jgi:hypothetical protein
MTNVGTIRVCAVGLKMALILLAFNVVEGCQSTEGESHKAAAPTAAPSAAAPATAKVVGLQAEVGCSRTLARTGIARLSWDPGSASAPQRIEMSVLAAGFSLNQFETSPALPPGQATYTWEGLHGQAFHFWRVATQNGASWVPGKDIGKFEGPTCPSDEG